MMMVVMVEQPTEMVVVEHLQGHLVDQETGVEMQEVLAHLLAHQDMDLVVAVVPVLSAVMDLTLHKLQLLEATDHQIVF